MSAAPPLKLKIRTAAGDKLITEGLTKQSTLADLKRRIEQLCLIPVDQQQCQCRGVRQRSCNQLSM